MNVKLFKISSSLPPNYTGSAEWEDGTICHYKEGLLHNNTGPAVIRTNGDKSYYLEGNKVSATQFGELLPETILVAGKKYKLTLIE